MATATPNRPAPAPKFESFVDQQLAQVRRRLRALDVGAAALMMLAITLGYAVIIAVFDLLVRGSDAAWVTGVRLLAFALFLTAFSGGAFLFVSRWLRRINPYYCARELEQTLPDAKNSVVNWLDLKNEHLPPAIRSSLGQRAAKDLKDANADRVVDPKQNWFLGGVAGLLFCALVVIFALSPGQFGSLLARAFVPFRGVRLADQATITLINPTGDAAVPQNSRVEFVAKIEGRFPKVNHPKSPKLWYRYGPGDPFAALPLDEDSFGQWTAALAPDQVQNGFWYKLSAGDAETPVYQVTVRSRPEATRFELTYHYRPYLKLGDETIIFPNEQVVFPEVRGPRGTDITLVVRTNQPVREGRLQVEFGKTHKEVPGERLPDDPKAFRCRFRLEQTGQFRVIFRTQDQESNTDSGSAYRIDVRDDATPVVVLTEPGKDVSLPANGTLPLKGFAVDDFGVKSLALRLRVADGAPKVNLAAKPYRPGKKFAFDSGTYPSKLEYQDFLALDQLKTEQNQPFPLSAGMILAYWLEATDNSDYPSATGNVGRSKEYKIAILEPKKDDKQQKDERQKAEKQQQQHEQQQDQQHKQENDQKNRDQESAKSGKTPEQQKAEDLEQKLKDTADKAKKAEEKEQQQKNQGEAKGDKPPKADNKSNDAPPDTQPKDPTAGSEPKKSDDKQKAGDKKDDGKKGEGAKNDAKPAEAKDGGGAKQPQDPQDQQQASEPKGPGDQKPPSSAKGQDGDSQTGKEPQPQDAKAGPKKDDPQQKPGAGKDQGQSSGGKDSKPSEAKNDAPKDDKDGKQGPQAKGANNTKDAPDPKAKKDQQGPKEQPAAAKSDPKPGKNEELAKEKGAGSSKPDPTASKQPPGADGSRKPAQAKGDEPNTQKSEAKDGGGPGQDQKQGPPAQVKKGQDKNPNVPPGSEQAQGESKQTPPDQAKESASAKDEKGQGPPREPTAKDLERLKDQLKNKDPKALDTAKELERNLPEATDPQMRKTGEDLVNQAAKLKDALAKENEPKVGPEPKDQDMGPGQSPMNDAKDPLTKQAPGKDPGPMGDQNKTPPKSQPDDKTPGANQGGSGEGGKLPGDNLKPSSANKSFADRLADLQLEDLKKRMTPEKRQAAGISDEEWQQFLKNAQSYEDLRARLQQPTKKGPQELKGTKSALPNFGPRQQNRSDGPFNPAAVGQPQPPPELRQAQELFSRPKQ